MITTPRSFLASHRDDPSRLVERTKKFSARIPVVGRRVSELPIDQFAFYGALGILAVLEVIDWPVALAVGIGEAVVTRHVNVQAAAQPEDLGPVSEREPDLPALKEVAPKASA